MPVTSCNKVKEGKIMAQTTMILEHTALPTTVKTQIDSDLTLPKGVKQLVGISVDSIRDTVTAGKPGHTKVSVESDDIALFNCEFLANPTHVTLGTGTPGYAGPKFWPIYAPVSGGETVQIYGTPQWDATDDPLMGVTVYVSDQAPVLAQRKGKVGTNTALPSATETVTDASLKINGGSVLETVYGVMTHAGVLAATDPIFGYGIIRSADMLPFQSIKFGVAGANGTLSTAGAPNGAPIEEVDVELALAASVSLELSLKAESTATNDYRGQIGVTYV
jgi:hypothetical protein